MLLCRLKAEISIAYIHVYHAKSTAQLRLITSPAMILCLVGLCPTHCRSASSHMYGKEKDGIEMRQGPLVCDSTRVSACNYMRFPWLANSHTSRSAPLVIQTLRKERQIRAQQYPKRDNHGVQSHGELLHAGCKPTSSVRELVLGRSMWVVSEGSHPQVSTAEESH